MEATSSPTMFARTIRECCSTRAQQQVLIGLDCKCGHHFHVGPVRFTQDEPLNCPLCALTVEFPFASDEVNDEVPVNARPVATTFSPSTVRVDQGGLMRCCLQSLVTYIQGVEELVAGEVVRCEHCTEQMLLHEDGVFRWNKEKVESV